MSDIINTGHAGLWALINDKNGGIDLPKPFEHDIFLLDTHIAGTTHIEGIMELEPFINTGDRLEMFREPDNEYDELAILVKNAGPRKKMCKQYLTNLDKAKITGISLTRLVNNTIGFYLSTGYGYAEERPERS